MHYHYRYKGGGIVFFLPPPLQPAVPGAYSGSMVAVSP